jgi:hypothetical protein
MNDQQNIPWVKKPKAPPADVRYAHKLGRGMLLQEQIVELVKPINPAYVGTKNSKTFLSQHQARAEMNRIFGYGNWSSQVLEMRLMYEERMHKDDVPKHPSFPRNGNAPVYWLSAYEACVHVEVRDLWGMPITEFSEWHAEENAPQPNRGEARALAMTSVESYALRRALIGLGDRLGLGLYNGGSKAAHGQYTIQLEGGILFDWVDARTLNQPQPEVAATPPVTQPSHDTIKAEPFRGDDEASFVPPEEQPPALQSPPVARAPQGQRFDQARDQIQAGNEQARQQMIDPQMAARIQAGMKRDAPGPAEAQRNVEVGAEMDRQRYEEANDYANEQAAQQHRGGVVE